MDLKELLGEDLFNQVNEKTGDKHKVAIVSDGNWIPKDKFNSVNDEVKELKTQISDRDKQLKDLGEKAKGNEELLKQITDLQETNKKTTQEYESKVQRMTFDYALEKALSGAEAKNVKAVKALLDLEKIKLNGEAFEGLDDQLKALKEKETYLFGKDSLYGRRPNDDGKSGAGANPWSKKTFNLTEQGKIFKENPELAKQLMAQAE